MLLMEENIGKPSLYIKAISPKKCSVQHMTAPWANCGYYESTSPYSARLRSAESNAYIKHKQTILKILDVVNCYI